METIDHILSKMREPSCFKGKIPVGRVDADFRYFADRIETVVKALVADRDNWRRQALAEDERANPAAALAEQRCKAKWKLGAEYEFAYCSHCGHQQWASWDSWREAVENIGEFCKEYKFCPNCGFKMKGAIDEQ
jgi:hypothetical protein